MTVDTEYLDFHTKILDLFAKIVEGECDKCRGFP